MLLTITPFAVIRQKSAYYAKYFRISWTYLDLLCRFDRCIDGDDYPDSRLAVAQETGCSRHRHERPLLFALVFDNGLADREATFKRLNGNN